MLRHSKLVAGKLFMVINGRPAILVTVALQEMNQPSENVIKLY